MSNREVRLRSRVRCVALVGHTQRRIAADAVSPQHRVARRIERRTRDCLAVLLQQHDAADRRAVFALNRCGIGLHGAPAGLRGLNRKRRSVAGVSRAVDDKLRRRRHRRKRRHDH